MRLFPIMILAACATPAAAADQFDLLCKGQQRFAVNGATQPVEARYRVDTAARRWCRDQCFSVEALIGATPEKLVFKSRPKTPPSEEVTDESFERATGKWVDLYVGPYPPGEYASTEGRCEVAPFSGFPKP